jgi:hypothetical protein
MKHLPLMRQSYYKHDNEAYLDALERLVATALSFGQTHAVDHPAATESPYDPAQETREAQERDFHLEQLDEDAVRFHEDTKAAWLFPPRDSPSPYLPYSMLDFRRLSVNGSPTPRSTFSATRVR